MTSRIARMIAWSLVGIYFVLAGTGIYLQALTKTTPGDIAIPLLPYFFVVIVVGIWPVIGAKIISHHPRHPVGWLLFATFQLVGVVMFAIGYASYAATLAPELLPLPGVILFWLKGPGLPTTIVALTLIYLLFPTGRLLSQRWQGVAWMSMGTLPVIIGLLMVIPGPLNLFPGLENPDAVSESVWASLSPLYLAMIALLTMCNLAAITSLFLRMRHKKGDEAQQVKWLLIPAIVYWIGIPGNYLGNFDPSGILLNLGVGLHLISVPAMVIAVAFAIFKYRLYDVDLLINRTLVYGTLTACVAGLYALIVGGAGLVMQTNVNLAGLLITAILVGAIYRPLRVFLQRGVDRLIPGNMKSQLDVSTHSSSEIVTNKVEEDKRIAQLDSAVSEDMVPVQHSARWMRFARLAWYPTFIIALWIFIPEFFNNVLGGNADFRYGDNTLVALMISRGVFPMFGSLVALFLGLLLFWHRSDDRMGLFTSFFLLVYGLVNSGTLEVLKPIFPDISHPNEITLPGFVAILTLVLFAVFPDGQFVPRWTRWVVWAAFLTILLILIRALLFPPSIVEFSQPGDLAFTVLIFVLVMVGWISIFYAQGYRYRYISTPQQRQQTKWALFGISASFGLQMFLGIPWIFSYILPSGFPFLSWQALSSMLYSLGIWALILPVTLTIAVMRYRLYDIDIFINRTLVYSALTATVIAAYVLIVGVLGTLLHTQGNLLITLLATGLIAVLFHPLRERLQRAVNRLIYGERDDPIEALSRLGSQMEVALPSEQVLPALVKTIAQTLKLPFVAITLKGQRDILFGQETENPVAFPFIFQGETTGVLLASPRNTGDKFTPGEMRLLQNLARQAGAVVRNAQLTADLQRSRQTLVTAREEERHRLRRDLHDGIGPAMAGLTLKLDATKDLVSSGLESGEKKDLEEAVQLLSELKTQTQETVQNIRHIAHTLRPPSLDVLGLVPAVQAHFGQVGTPHNMNIQMTTIPQNFPRLSAAVEVAAYHIVLEAVTNVIKHAQTGLCQVSLALDNGNLKLEIKDNGVGLKKGRGHGIGLDSMRERAEELGGRFELFSSPQGTHVCAEIPVSPIGKEP